jgi:hypothetical protein
MLFFPVYIEAHPSRRTVFASRPDVWALAGNRRRFPVPEMNLRDSILVSRMNLRDATHSTLALSCVPHTSAPPALQTVSKLVTPTAPTTPTGTLYPFSFQFFVRSSSPLWSNRTPFISFNFILLRAFSIATNGVHESVWQLGCRWRNFGEFHGSLI